MVQIIGLATGGRLGVRVTDHMGIQTSRFTILRRSMALPAEPVELVLEVGIDDFSFRRGRTFGTILGELQSHKVIDPRRQTAKQKPPTSGCKLIQKSIWSVVIAEVIMPLERVRALHNLPDRSS